MNAAWFRALYTGGVIAFLAAPLIVVAGVSVNSQRSLVFPPEGISLSWYAELFVQSDWSSALINSLLIAIGAGLLAVAIALPLAVHAWATKSLLARALFGLGVAPFMLPPVISALGFMVFWISFGLYGNMLATVVSHGIFLVTLPLVTISIGLADLDELLIEAAQTLGADRRTVFRTVLFPIIRPYLVSGFAFAFVLSLNEYIIAYMVAGFSVETLPIKIFNSLRYGYTPIMAVVAVMFAAISACVFGLVGWFGNLPRLLGAERT